MADGEQYILGVDIGGTSTKAGLVNADGAIVARGTMRSDVYSDPGEYIYALTETLRRMTEPFGGFAAVDGAGIGAPNGNHLSRMIEGAHNVTWCRGDVPIAALLSSATGLPVALTNDANAAALGEMRFGAARGMRNFIVLTLGTGIGSGIVIDGRVVYGSNGLAGELGHTKVAGGGERHCRCGLTGCLEAYCSATGVAATARDIVLDGIRDTVLNDLTADKIDAEAVYDAATKGDAVSIEILQDAGCMLGESAANFVLFSAPEAIILFGGLARAGELLRRPMVDAMNRNLPERWRGRVSIEFSALPFADAAILGAAALIK